MKLKLLTVPRWLFRPKLTRDLLYVLFDYYVGHGDKVIENGFE